MNKKLIALGLSVLTAFTLLTGCAGEKGGGSAAGEGFKGYVC